MRPMERRDSSAGCSRAGRPPAGRHSLAVDAAEARVLSGAETNRSASTSRSRGRRAVRGAQEVERRVLDPAQRLREEPFERNAQQRVCAAPRHRPAHLLEQRPGQRVAGDEHLPAWLDAETIVDDELCVVTVARGGHRGDASGGRAPPRRVGVDLLHPLDLRHIAPCLGKLDPDALGTPTVDVPLSRVVGGERGRSSS